MTGAPAFEGVSAGVDGVEVGGIPGAGDGLWGGLDGVGKGDWGVGRTYFTWRGWRGVAVAGGRRVRGRGWLLGGRLGRALLGSLGVGVG